MPTLEGWVTNLKARMPRLEGWMTKLKGWMTKLRAPTPTLKGWIYLAVVAVCMAWLFLPIEKPSVICLLCLAAIAPRLIGVVGMSDSEPRPSEGPAGDSRVARMSDSEPRPWRACVLVAIIAGAGYYVSGLTWRDNEFEIDRKIFDVFRTTSGQMPPFQPKGPTQAPPKS